MIDLGTALRTHESAESLIGGIPVDIGPVGLATSPDGRHLYVTSEVAKPTDAGYDPTACDLPTATGTGTTAGPQSTITAVNVAKAEHDPAQSIEADAMAGYSPVRVALSDHGRVAWVTARAENDVLALDTRRLITDPAHDLISRTPVGVAPVGIQPFDDGRLIAVANSSRFSAGQEGSVSIVDSRAALDAASRHATIATFAVGSFPRQWALSG